MNHRQEWTVRPNAAAAIAERIGGDVRRILLFGKPGAGKSTLCEALARSLIGSGRDCCCINADPGSPAFGLPGTVSMGLPVAGGWEITRWEPLCTLDAGRFRLPLATAVRSLLEDTDHDLLLLDSPGVVRGVAGHELLEALVKAADIDLVLAVVPEGHSPPLTDELHALGTRVCVVPADPEARRPGRRARARTRTAQWDAHLSGAGVQHLNLAEVRIIGTPPPLETSEAWIGRQVALLRDGRPEAMAEVLGIAQGRMELLTPERVEADALLVRDGARDSSGLLQSAPPFAAERIDYFPRTGPATAADHDGGPGIEGRMGSVDFTLVNGVFGDPLLHLHLRHLGRSLLFDLGEGSRLSARVAHRVTDVFISHAHMDHIGGFQWLLRSRLGDFPPCRIHGPPGLAERIAHFIGGFLWDRIGSNGPVFEITELHGQHLKRFRLQAGRGKEELLEEGETREGVLLREPGFRVRAVELDHHTPVLAFSLALAQALNIRKDRLRAKGLQPGPWLTQLKQQLLAGNRDAVIELPDGSRSTAGELGQELVLVSPEKKLVYATDLADTPGNRERLVGLARNAHTFFCEAAFSEADADRAFLNGHLTTRAAGEIAASAGVSRLLPFHFSRRYRDSIQQLYDELTEACPQVVLPRSMKVFEPLLQTGDDGDH